MKALDEPSPRWRYEPTFYGQSLASFSLAFDASVLLLKFAEAGLLQKVYSVCLPILWWRLQLYCPNWSKGDDTNWKLGCISILATYIYG
uniref:Uncharacterized protein n=1 Tax=Salix viminalis TaxID=40686 RepID=A0A6N2N1F8_SALVM